jgi:hypothetical protein
VVAVLVTGAPVATIAVHATTADLAVARRVARAVAISAGPAEAVISGAARVAVAARSRRRLWATTRWPRLSRARSAATSGALTLFATRRRALLAARRLRAS